jgi:hypothetical protein
MGLFGLFSSAVNAAFDIEEAREVIREGFVDALSTMEGMVGNEGQQSVYDDYVVPEFEAAVGPINEGWPGVDIGEYMDFMGEIVEEGNTIMEEAYGVAQELLSEIEEALEEAEEEGFDLDDL